MAPHTTQGDDGFTRAGGERLRKDAALPAAVGALDELNAAIGLCLCEAGRINHVFIAGALEPIQSELFLVGTEVVAAGGGEPTARLEPAAVERLERDIDTVCEELPPLAHFVLPRGCELAGRLHLARTVARRAERAVVAALDPGGKTSPPAAGVLPYLNRLSDLLFALARLANRDSGECDTTWAP